ncbi:DUF6114 domain-containing protein [Skermania sp. ID1734]|uniref:DUF6114 domain-containing protein n=1 Tax=Skermania sp. ID1734 TaxID=2597516 RepID=UPI002104FF96|nr:DUF6114 domain-containing protein [Skermania sp. ID1734]
MLSNLLDREDGDTAQPPAESAPAQAARPNLRDSIGRAISNGRNRIQPARAWFRAFRRTRPFWGGLWMIIGGWCILRLSMVSIQVVMSAGLTGFGGWLSGGGLIMCGLFAWAAPSQRYVAGLIGLLLGVVSLVISNLGGLGLGMLFGVIGGSMTLAWGPKRTRKPTAAAVEDDTESSDHIEAGDHTESGEASEPAG